MATVAGKKTWPSFGSEVKWDFVSLVIPLIGTLPMLSLQVANMWDKPHLQFFPVAIGLIAWLAFREIPMNGGLAGGKRKLLAVISVLLTYILAVVGVWIYSPWVCYLCLVTSFTAWAFMRLHQTEWPWVVAFVAVLGSTIPIPLDKDRQLVAKLQEWSSRACSYALDGLGIPNLLQGNVIQIESHALFVEEACSGVTSFYSLLTLALLFAVFQRRSLVVALLTIAVTPCVAVVTNFARLMIIAVGFSKLGIDLSKGWQHTLTGLIVFLGGLLILLSFDVFISKLLAVIPKLRSERSLFRRIYNSIVGWPNKTVAEVDGLVNKTNSSSTVSFGDRLRFVSSFSTERWLPYVAIAYVLVFVPALAASLNEYRMNQFMFGCPDVTEEIDSTFPGDKDLPEIISETWNRTGYKIERRDLQSTFGQCSHMWVYASGERDLILSLDFPFRGWHALQNCYTSSGWGTVSNNVCRRTEDDSWPWVEQEFVNDLGLRGYLWYGLFDENLKPYFVDMKGPSFAARMNRGVWKIWAKNDPIRSPVTFQYQLFVESGEPLTDQQRQEFRRVFLETREIVLQKSVPAVQKLSGR